MNASYLWDKLNPAIQNALVDDSINEIILNPDGHLWFIHCRKGCISAGTHCSILSKAFVYALAHMNGLYLNRKTPYLDATLPFHGERINITIPPICNDISFNIRKHVKHSVQLIDYLDDKTINQATYQVLQDALNTRLNILVSGGPGSGKTTFVNALINELEVSSSHNERILLLEQVPELQCQLPNTKRLLVSHTTSMHDLVWLSMRNTPDRLIIGEVRDGAALDMLKAWNTGCKGGIATIHANSAEAALQRVLDLSAEATTDRPYSLTGEAIDLIIHIDYNRDRHPQRLVTSPVRITKYCQTTDAFILSHIHPRPLI